MMELVSSHFRNGSGPFWLMQLWLQAYFPKFAPFIPTSIPQSDCFGLRFMEKRRPTPKLIPSTTASHFSVGRW
ncbi:hypothetical protein ACSBR2_017540 [Camellia fascicularis]